MQSLSIAMFKEGYESGLQCELCSIFVEKVMRSFVVRKASRKGYQNVLKYRCEFMVSKKSVP